jgi:hypothetical protein
MTDPPAAKQGAAVRCSASVKSTHDLAKGVTVSLAENDSNDSEITVNIPKAMAVDGSVEWER